MVVDWRTCWVVCVAQHNNRRVIQVARVLRPEDTKWGRQWFHEDNDVFVACAAPPRAPHDVVMPIISHVTAKDVLSVVPVQLPNTSGDHLARTTSAQTDSAVRLQLRCSYCYCEERDEYFPVHAAPSRATAPKEPTPTSQGGASIQVACVATATSENGVVAAEAPSPLRSPPPPPATSAGSGASREFAARVMGVHSAKAAASLGIRLTTPSAVRRFLAGPTGLHADADTHVRPAHVAQQTSPTPCVGSCLELRFARFLPDALCHSCRHHLPGKHGVCSLGCGAAFCVRCLAHAPHAPHTPHAPHAPHAPSSPRSAPPVTDVKRATDVKCVGAHPQVSTPPRRGPQEGGSQRATSVHIVTKGSARRGSNPVSTTAVSPCPRCRGLCRCPRCTRDAAQRSSAMVATHTQRSAAMLTFVGERLGVTAVIPDVGVDLVPPNVGGSGGSRRAATRSVAQFGNPHPSKHGHGGCGSCSPFDRACGVCGLMSAACDAVTCVACNTTSHRECAFADGSHIPTRRLTCDTKAGAAAQVPFIGEEAVAVAAAPNTDMAQAFVARLDQYASEVRDSDSCPEEVARKSLPVHPGAQHSGALLSSVVQRDGGGLAGKAVHTTLPCMWLVGQRLSVSPSMSAPPSKELCRTMDVPMGWFVTSIHGFTCCPSFTGVWFVQANSDDRVLLQQNRLVPSASPPLLPVC